MSLSRRFSLAAISVFLLCGLACAQAGNETQAAKQETFAYQALPKAFACPEPAALGNVSLRINIDVKGNVSEAKAVAGPEESLAAAEACAKTWKYENPPPAPVTKTVLLHYESRDCPGAESQRGALQFSWALQDRLGNVVAYMQAEEPPPPPYPDEERKAGIAGRMALSVSLNADGTVKEVRVMRGLSPGLDKAATDHLRELKFTVVEGVSDVQLKDTRMQIFFHAVCAVQSVSNDN